MSNPELIEFKEISKEMIEKILTKKMPNALEMKKLALIIF